MKRRFITGIVAILCATFYLKAQPNNYKETNITNRK